MSRLPFTTPLAALTIMTTLAHAAPDQLCLPQTANPTPAWWNPGLGPNQKESRWSNALVRTRTIAPAGGRLRALWSPAEETVYLEFRVEGDTSLDPVEDVVLLALGDEDGLHPELFIRVSPVAACAGGACAGAGAAVEPSSIEYAEATAGPISLTWGPLTGTPPASPFTLSHPWIVVEELSDGFTWTFSVAMTLPVTGSGHIRPLQRIYGNVVAYAQGPTSGTTRELTLLCKSSSPISDDCKIDPNFNTDLPGDLPWLNMDDTWSVLRSICLTPVPPVLVPKP